MRGARTAPLVATILIAACALAPSRDVGAAARLEGDCEGARASGHGPVHQIDRRLCRAFAIARRPARRGDVPFVDRRPWAVEQGINLELARRARRVGRRRGIYLLPGRRTACMYFGRRYGSFTCERHRRAARGSLHLFEGRRRGFAFAQLVPDGTSRVRLVIDGYRPRSLEIRDNAVTATSRVLNATGYVEWRDRQGERHRVPFDLTPPSGT